jgi:hypothetical protein
MCVCDGSQLAEGMLYAITCYTVHQVAARQQQTRSHSALPPSSLKNTRNDGHIQHHKAVRNWLHDNTPAAKAVS